MDPDKITAVLKRMFSLLVVLLMLCATTVTSGRLFGHEWADRPDDGMLPDDAPVALREPDALQKRDLGIIGSSLAVRDSISWTVTSKAGEPLGVLLSSERVGADVEGFAGKTPVFVLVGTDGMIGKMAVGQNDETPAFVERASESIFAAYAGKNPEDVIGLQVDAVTGATYSSNGLIGNIREVLAAYNASEVKLQHAPAIGWVRTIAVLLVFAIGLIVAFRFRGKKWVRIAVLALNVGVTGFWCGQFISLSILTGWVKNGLNVVTVLPTLVMLVIALLMPYLGKANHYCMSMCPYGSLQELVWHIPVKKLRMKPAVIKWMGRIRTSVFIVLMALLWLGWGGSVLEYEPFGAFMVETAAPAVMVLAGLFVVLAVFIPRPWCKTFCPVGELLHLAETPMFKKRR